VVGFTLSEGAMPEKPAAYFEGLDDGKLVVRVQYTDTVGKHEFRLVLPPRMPIGSHTGALSHFVNQIGRRSH
jgi:hypothetical protein